MAEAVKSITASTYSATTGTGIRYVGNWAYAHSGSVENVDQGAAATTTVLDFTSGAGLIVAKLAWISESSGGPDQYIDYQLNDLSIFKAKFGSADAVDSASPLRFIIPPLAHFVAKWGLEGATSNVTFVLMGRVYGAE